MTKQEISNYAAQLYGYLKEKRVGRKQCVADMLLKLAPEVDWYGTEGPDVMLAIEDALSAMFLAEGEFVMDSSGANGMIIGLSIEIPFVFRKKSQPHPSSCQNLSNRHDTFAKKEHDHY